MTLTLQSRIGFGTWQLGGDSTFGGKPNGWGVIDEQEAKRAILFALENGIAFFDTADGYGKGRSEEILGQTIANNPKAIICTKFGNREDEFGIAYQDFSAQWLQTAVENSLRRLKRETIDILLLHSPPDNFNWINYDITPLENLIQTGKIRSYGVSNKTHKGVENVINHNFGTTVEAIYNALDRRVSANVLPLCETKNYNFIARVPLASGFLTEKTLFNEAKPLSVNDFRNNFTADITKWFIEQTTKLSFLNDLEGGISVSALRFCLSNPAVSVVIPGMRNVKQVEQALLAQKLGALSEEILEKIKQKVPTVFAGWL